MGHWAASSHLWEMGQAQALSPHRASAYSSYQHSRQLSKDTRPLSIKLMFRSEPVQWYIWYTETKKRCQAHNYTCKPKKKNLGSGSQLYFTIAVSFHSRVINTKYAPPSDNNYVQLATPLQVEILLNSEMLQNGWVQEIRYGVKRIPQAYE